MATQTDVPMTPWVTRLLALNGAIFVLLSTVFTAPRFLEAVAFDSGTFLSKPWTVLTYMFSHEGFFALALNSLALFLFGPLVERRLGPRRFIAYYLYCGIGAAVFSLVIGTVYQLDPLVGASGAVLGVCLAHVLNWPHTPISGLPLPAAAKTVFLLLLCSDMVLGVSSTEGASHLAHFGGVLAGYLFFRLQALATNRPATRPASIRRPVVTPMRMQETPSERRPTAPAGVPEVVDESTDQNVDRLLDKISQFGIDSLSSEERRALSDAAERKRREHP